MAPSGTRTPPFFIAGIITLATTLILLIIVLFHNDILSIVQNSQLCAANTIATKTTYRPPTSPPNRPYMFRDTPSIEQLSLPAHEAFSSFLAPNDGAVRVQSTNDELTSFTETPGVEFWGISMFHGMHCLSMIYMVLQTVPGLQNLTNPALHHAGDHTTHHHTSRSEMPTSHADMIIKDPVHVGHCVAYIAQMIMCAADGTLEPPWVERDKAGNIVDVGISGEGHQHQCRDASLLWKAAALTEENPLPAWDWKAGDSVQDVFR